MNSESVMYALITKWANDRNIINGCGVKDQFPKLISEFGELVGAIEDLESLSFRTTFDEYAQVFDSIQERIIDGIGDTAVVLTVLAGQLGVEMTELAKNPICSDLGTSRDSRIRLTTSAFGFLGDAIAKNQKEEALSFIAIAVSLLSAISYDCKTSLIDCLTYSYDEIKDRKGVMYNGTFIKESDPVYEEAYNAVFK